MPVDRGGGGGAGAEANASSCESPELMTPLEPAFNDLLRSLFRASGDFCRAEGDDADVADCFKSKLRSARPLLFPFAGTWEVSDDDFEDDNLS